ncbi:MAG: hypothetical protein IIX93_11220 [Clostridia bacterium]|nr:hypothetical protein [Clostridia bacterium]
MKQKKALREYIYRKPLIGGKLVFLGALVMFIWSGWECILRYDAMDGMTKAYINLVKTYNIPVREAIQNIWNTPEAREDWLNILILGSIAVFALVSFFLSRFWKPGFLVIPVCVAIMFYHTSESMIVRTLNLFEGIKFVSALAVMSGESMNIYSALQRKRRFLKELKAGKKAPRRLPAHGTSKTLIPERKKPGFGM